MTYDLILHNAKGIATPGGILSEGASVGVIDGKIFNIGDLDPASAKEVIDCTGLHVLPGVIDTQVHFREPGNEHKEDLESGTKSAVLGGVTAIFEMPNTNPLTITEETINDKIARATGRSWCDFAFYVGGCAQSIADLPELEKLPGVCGVKIFMGASTGDLLSPDDETIEKILASGNRLVAVHAEDNDRLDERKELATDVTQHPVWRDEEVCRKATERLLKLARKTGRRVHVLHITTADEVPLLQENKDVSTMEVLVNHLTLAAPECYEQLGSRAQQNPPVREQHHQDMLWTAVREGIVDIVATDHAPHTAEEKAQDYPASPAGMPGVQTLVPVMLDHVNAGRLSLERFVDLVAHGPNRVFNIANKGRLVSGYDADFTLVDLAAERTITNDWIGSKCGWTPYDGKKVTGWPIATIIRGAVIMKDGELLSPGQGQPVVFRETLAKNDIQNVSAAA